MDGELKRIPKEAYKGWEIRKVRTFIGMDGEGFNLDLHRDGRKVAFAMDDGNGGCIHFDFKLKADEDAFLATAKAAAPDIKFEPMDWLLNSMIDDYKNDKRFARLSKTRTLVQVGDAIGGEEFQAFRRPYDETVKAELLKMFEGNRVFVWGVGIISDQR